MRADHSEKNGQDKISPAAARSFKRNSRHPWHTEKCGGPDTQIYNSSTDNPGHGDKNNRRNHRIPDPIPTARQPSCDAGNPRERRFGAEKDYGDQVALTGAKYIVG